MNHVGQEFTGPSMQDANNRVWDPTPVLLAIS